MKKVLLTAFTALMIHQAPAQAVELETPEFLEGIEIGIGIGALDMNLNESGTLVYISAQKDLGMMVGDFDSFAEVRLGTSSAAKTGPDESSFDGLLSALFKNNIETQDGINIYGLAGFSLSNVAEDTATTTNTITDLSFTYGFGANYEFIQNAYIGIEYTDYSERATAFSINTSYKF